MAEIPVEKKFPLPPWLMFALAALILLLLAILLFDFGDDDAELAETTPTDVTYTDGADAALVTIAAIGPGMTGETARLDGVRVTEVIGDVSFRVEGAGGENMLVLLDEEATPNRPGTEGRYDINVGQTISLWGTVQRGPLPDDVTLDEDGTAVAGLPDERGVYLLAQRANIEGGS